MKCTTPGCQLDARPRTAPSGPAPTKCKPCFSKSPSAKNVRTLPERQAAREQARPVEVRTDASVRNAPTAKADDPQARLRDALDAAGFLLIREGRRLREIAKRGLSAWTCVTCGPLAQDEQPVHGQDERMHCPRCDGETTTGERGDRTSKSAWRSAPATGGGE